MIWDAILYKLTILRGRLWDFLSDYMPKPEPKEPTTEEIINFYCRYGNKKMTAERFCITVKELNTILKGAKIKKDKNDKYAEVGMSRRDFY